ncbi:AMP-binding protein [Nocardia sp. XZ_19_231]|uniref:AMP-binding protein n=1 Tax=Nocardia sp. XZ_19_231 TaxID=2769252 RepID=UPI0018906A83|nr:AMP-binding protein [Nocardia sp. XZ_19_231]
MLLTDLARDLGDKRAVVLGDSGRSLTFRQLEAESNRIARVLRARGLRRGDHLALLFDNCLELFPVVWAAQRTGLRYTPVNWHLSAAEAVHIVADCGARLLISAPGLESVASAVEQACPGIDRIVTGTVSGVPDLATLTADVDNAPIGDEAEGYYMFYSSGTTGRPKGVLPELSGAPFGTGLPIDHRMASVFGFDRTSVYLSAGPLYHAAPLAWTLGTIRNGGTAVIMERFDAEAALGLIERHRVTHAQFVPTMFVRMLKLSAEIRDEYDMSSLCSVVHSAAPCPVAVKQQMIDWLGPCLVEFYGGTEGSGFCTIDSVTWLARPGSVGQPLRGAVHICDTAGRELGPGEVGVVWFSGAGRFSYHGDSAKTAAAHNDRGWNTLGDLGHIDSDGFLYLSGRRSDLILSGGVNIYPQEIEDVLILHPAVADVGVIGLPDEEYGQRVHAVVALADPTSSEGALMAELMEYCRDRLAHFKCPRSIDVGAVPRLPSGKLLRRALLDGYTIDNSGALG